MHAITAALICFAVVLPAAGEEVGPLRIDGLLTRQPERVLVFVVRGEGIDLSVVSFMDVVRKTLEAHMDVQMVSLEDAFVREGDSLQRRLAECKGDDGCYKHLADRVDALYLLVITASRIGQLEVAGARFLKRGQGEPLGNAIDPLSPGMEMLDAIPARIQAAVPPELWDPFGSVVVRVDQPVAEVTINGKAVGVTPIGTIGFLLPGSYKVAATKNGYKRVETDVVVVRNKDAMVAFTMEEEETPGLLPWWGWTLIGVGVAAGAGVGIGLAASSKGAATFCSTPMNGTPCE